MRARSSRTFSSRFSARSPWTSDSAGLFCSVDIAAKSGLELAQAEVLHFAAKVARLDLEAADALLCVLGEPIQLARVNEHAQREPLAVLFDHVLVAGHGPARDLGLRETADPSHQHVDRTAHQRHASAEATVAPEVAEARGRSGAGQQLRERPGAAPRSPWSACQRPEAGRRRLYRPARSEAPAPASAYRARP